MSESDDSQGLGLGSGISQPTGRPSVVDLSEIRKQREAEFVGFHRRELDIILRVYGRMVADGHWRDYAIDHLKDRALFSAFRRASEVPLYRIVKEPARARKQGAYSIVSGTGAVLKRGHDLAQVMRYFDATPKVVK